MVPRPFEGSMLKVERGFKHFEELKSEIDKYIARDPAAAFVQRHKETGEYRISFSRREDVPAHLTTIFGDAIHNLRVALDLMANDLVALAGVTPKGVYFPFADSEFGLEQQIKTKMKGAPDDVLNIIRGLKPYRGGNTLLRGLHDLDVNDKHKSIMQIRATQGISPPMKPAEMEFGSFKMVGFEADWAAMPTVSIDMTGFEVSPDADTIGKVVGSKIEVLLADGLPLGGNQVLAVVHQAGDMVQRIVKTFEAHCVGREHSPK